MKLYDSVITSIRDGHGRTGRTDGPDGGEGSGCTRQNEPVDRYAISEAGTKRYKTWLFTFLLVLAPSNSRPCPSLTSIAFRDDNNTKVLCNSITKRLCSRFGAIPFEGVGRSS